MRTVTRRSRRPAHPPLCRSFSRWLLAFTVMLPAAALLARPATAASHPFAARDLWELQRVSDPQASPDGHFVAFTLRTTDFDANRGRNDLWLVGIDGSGLRRLTSHEAADVSPRWSPDGTSLYFLSTRSGSQQVWRLSLAGGEAEQVTRQPLDVAAFVLSPDGGRLALAMDVFVDAATPAATADRLEAVAARKASGRVYDRLLFRHWDTWGDGRRSHLFVVPVAGGEPIDIMKGMDADSPSKPFGGAEEFAFTPDGRGVVFAARDVGASEAWSTDLDLYVAPADGSAKPMCLTSDNDGLDTNPVFSPDGRTLAYLSMARPGYEADRLRVMLRTWDATASTAAGASGAARELAAEWDRSPNGIVWSPDGKLLYAEADHLGHHSIFALDVAKNTASVVVLEGTAHGPSIAGRGGKQRLVYALDTYRSPAELFSVKPDGSDVRRLTDINGARLADIRMGAFEQFSFQGANDDRVYGFIVKPVDFDPAKKYPVAFLIHGGPQGSFGNNFHYRWNPQVYAGAGYASILIDFHGSTGYGQAFCDAIRNDWGGKPLVDLQKGLAAALERYAWMDGTKVAALGASYGGYMVNWIAGNWPDRFTCLVSHDGNLDERAAYYMTEELWFPEWDHGGTPWDNPASYEKQNPVNFVQNWKTPILVVHGGQDFRVVETSGFATFTAAQRRGVPSRFLYFPDENHWVLKPHNSLLWHETVIGWLDQWTKDAPAKASR